MCLLFLALLIISMRAASSILNDLIFIRNGFALQDWKALMIPAWIPCLTVWWENRPVSWQPWESLWHLWSAVGDLGAEWSLWPVTPVDWFRSAAGCCQEGQAAGSCLQHGSEGPQCRCSLFAQWLYGRCLTSPWTCFPLWSAHITYKQSCVSRFSASKCWRSSKNISFIQTAVVAVSESLTRGFIPMCPQLPCSEVVVYSSCILLMIQDVIKRQLRPSYITGCQGFSLAVLPCMLFACWLSGTWGFSVNRLTPEPDVVVLSFSL